MVVVCTGRAPRPENGQGTLLLGAGLLSQVHSGASVSPSAFYLAQLFNVNGRPARSLCNPPRTRPQRSFFIVRAGAAVTQTQRAEG